MISFIIVGGTEYINIKKILKKYWEMLLISFYHVGSHPIDEKNL